MQDADAAITELERTGRAVVRSRTGGVALALLGAVAFTAAGAALVALWLVEPSWPQVPGLVAGAAGVLFFGVVGVPTLVWRWATAARSITITADEATLAGGSRMRWALVRSARVASVMGQRFVVLLPRDEPDALRGLSPLVRVLSRWNGRLLGEPAAVALPVQVALSPAALLRLVQHARRRGGHLRP